jgi:hypothetical protein
MTEAEEPRLPRAFIGGTIAFGTGTFLTAGSYALLAGVKQPLTYAFFTSLNVGVAGGLFTGTFFLNSLTKGSGLVCFVSRHGCVSSTSLIEIMYMHQ